MTTRFEATVALNAGKCVFQDGDIGLFIDDVKVIDFTEIDKKVLELQAEFAAKQYQRDRHYASWQEQMDMQYWDQVNGTTTWQDAIAKVKSDNPKE